MVSSLVPYEFVLNLNEVLLVAQDVYSWSRHTPVRKCRVLILGQDPYHDDKQAHGLCFSVMRPVRPPPSLKNIYKELVTE